MISRTARAALVTSLAILAAAPSCSADRPTAQGDRVALRAAPSKSAAPGATSERSPRKRPGPWPTARNTGAHGHLRTISGRTIRTDGAVLRDVRVRGRITIEADHVTLDNVYIDTDDYYGILVWGRSARIENTTISGTRGATVAGLAYAPGGSFHARRINVFGSEDGVRLGSRSSLRHSFIHGLQGDADSHYDSVTADGAHGWRITHNRILNHHGQTAAIWVGDPRYGPSSGIVRDNLIGGGGYTIYAGHGSRRGIRVIDNRFTTKYFPRSGYWGLVADWKRANNEWSGNRWLDGRRKGRPARP